MQLQLFIQQLLTILFPIFGVTLPGILKKNHYPLWVNGLIAGVVVLLCGAGYAFARGQLGNDLAQNFFVIVAAMGAMLAGPLQGLDAFLQAHINSGPASNIPPATPATPASPPSPLSWPGGPAGAPPTWTNSSKKQSVL